MRNLKRALSLGLTAAMISGLMVMGSSAASSSYTDVADTDNVEAIEVLKSVGIMVGDESGDFNPDQNVTRNEMAVVMSNLMAYNVATYKDTSPFTDVPSWAEPYVAACYTNKITAGTSATTYGGSESVTTAQAALMVMKALGYFQYSTDFGGDWQLATVAQGNKIDLFTDVDSGVKEAMTRNDVAQLVLNALEAGTVEAEKSGQDITVGDITITSGVTYKYVTSGRDYATAINKKLATYTDGTYSTGAIVELGEKLYQGDLTKKEDQDDFGRPANIWEYQGKEVGTFAEKPDYTFTSKVTSKALYNEVGKTAAENYIWYVYQNGNLIKDYGKGDLADNKADDDADFVVKELQDNLARTGNGVITDVYVDGTEETVHVAIIDQYAAEVLKVDKEDGTITLSDLNGTGDVRASDEFDATGYNEDDVVIYTYANDKIQSVYPAQRMEGEVTAVRTTTKVENTVGGVENDGDYFVVDGTTYKYNATATKDRLVTENVNNGVVAYLDAQGYVAYIDESAITYDYAYVLSMGSDNDQYGSEGHKGTTYYARLVLTDGTMIKVETDETTDALNHHIVSYSKDKNNVYSLTDKSTKAITTDTALNIENGKASMDINFNDKVRYTANANTVFIVADSDPDKFDEYDFTVYTGVKNVPDIEGLGKGTASTSDDTKVVVAANGSVAKVVYIEDADVSGTGEIIFARADAKAKYVEDSKVGNYYEINAYKDGAAVTLKVKESSSAASELVKRIDSSWGVKLNDNQYLVALKGVTENSDGLVTSVREYDAYVKSTGDGVITGTGTNKYEKDVVGLSGYGDFSFVENEVVAQYNDKDNKNEFKTSRINGIKTDSNDKYIAVLEGDVIAGICTVYVNGGENDSTGNLPSGTESTTVGKFTFITDKASYVTNPYAIVNNSGEVVFQFNTNIGAADNAQYKFNYTIKAGDTVLENVSKTVPANNGVVSVTSNGKIFTSDNNYTITISGITVDKYAIETASNVSGISKNDMSVDPTTLATGGNTLKLAINSGVSANDKADVVFSVQNVKDVIVAPGVTSLGNDRYSFSARVNNGKIASTQVFNSMKPDGNGAVKVTLESVSDQSAQVAVNFVLDSASTKYATLSGTTNYSVNTGATSVNAASGSITLKSNVTKADVTYKVTGVTSETQDNDFTGGSMSSSVNIPAAVKGNPITVTVSVIPTEYTVNTLIDGTGTAVPLKFDKDGKIVAGNIATGATQNKHYLVEIAGQTKAFTADASNNIKAIGGEFTLASNQLTDSNSKLIVKITLVLKVTAPDQINAGRITNSAAQYTYETTLKSGTGIKSGNDWYVTSGSTLEVTIKYMNGSIGDSKKDTITVTSASNTPTPATVDFTDANHRDQVVVVTVGSTDNTNIALTGANANA